MANDKEETSVSRGANQLLLISNGISPPVFRYKIDKNSTKDSPEVLCLAIVPLPESLLS